MKILSFQNFSLQLLKNKEHLVSITGVLTNKFALVVLQIILVRLLAPADYSSFFFYYSSITGLSVFIGEGLGIAVSRFLSTSNNSHEKIVLNSLSTGALTSIFAGLLLFIQISLMWPKGLHFLTLAPVILLASMLSLSSVLQYICASVDLKRFLGLVQIFFAVVTLTLASSAAFFLEWSHVITAILIAMTASNLVLIYKLFKERIKLFARPQWAVMLDLMSKSLPICGAMALGAPVHVYCLSILKQTTFHVNPAEVGIFGISFVAYTLVSFLPGALGQFLVPWLLKNKENSTVESAYKTATKIYTVIGILLLLFIALCLEFGITNLVPSLQNKSSTIIILSSTGLIAGYIALMSFYLNAIYRSRNVFFSSIYHSVSYVILTHVLVKDMNLGANGLAIAILISSSGQLIFLQFIKNRSFGLESNLRPEQWSLMNSFLFKQLIKYISWHYSLIFKVYSHLIVKTSKHLFCYLFNFGAFIRCKKVRFKYNESTKNYSAFDKSNELVFFHTKQANMAYANGIPERAHQLGVSYFLDLIPFKENDTIIDCGANVGDLFLYFKTKKIKVNYTGVEPSPLEFKSLVSNVAPQKAFNLGLWHENGNLKFYVSSQGADSSLIEPIRYDEIINVETKRLDTLIEGPIKLLKIEAEGAEPEVLLGCSQLLKDVEYISADLGFERGKEQTSTLAPVVNYLLNHNFELITVSHDRVVALFKNKKLSGSGL